VSQLCPICSVSVPPSPRYPRYVCRECVSRASSRDGRPVAFTNTRDAPRVGGRYRDRDQPYAGQECWIDGIRCWAEEAHFGGVVIKATD
jgi:hypothetical protein